MSSTLIRRLTSTFLALIVSIAVLWWLLGGGIDRALLDALRTSSPWPLVLGASLAIAIQVIRAWRFAILTTGRLAWPSWTMTGIATKLVLFNFLLPFKLGELSFPLMMKRVYGTPLGQGAGILVLCRLLDLGIVAAFILLTASWLLDPAVLGWSPPLIGMLGLIALIAPLLLMDSLPWFRHVTARWPRLDHLAEQISRGAVTIRPLRQRLAVAVLTFSIWLAHASIAWLVAKALGAGLGFFAMTMASASSNLAFALPISGVAGLGPPQAAWATMLRLAGHEWAPAIASALLCHGLLIATLSVFGVVFWLIESLRAKPAIGKDGSAPSAGAG